MSLFTGAAGYYQQYRFGIPDSVAAILDDAVGRHHPRRLLDIGTGTGFVVQALLGRFDDIIAIDADSDMLAAAEAALRPQLLAGTHLTFAHTTAEDFTPPDGWNPDLVTICRAFRWLDQPAVLAKLDTHVSPYATVAILNDNSSIWISTVPWKTAVRAVVQDFLGELRRAGSGVFTHHHRPYSEILRESPFSKIEEITIPVRRTRTADNIIGYLHSTSFAAPHLFGDQLDDFDRAVRARLTQLSATDTFIDDYEFHILLGRRP